jgi:aquaporin Z
MARKLIAEFVGTFMLVFLAVGTAVVGIKTHGTGFVALAFGLVLVLGVYAIGPVSGCHINPAVTIAMVVSRRMPWSEAIGYWIAQLAGAILGGAVLKLMTSAFDVTDETGALGTNSWGVTINGVGAFVVEVLLTFVFALIVLLATDRASEAALAGIAIGATLAVVHLVGIPLTGTSVNPARSIGPALFEGGEALKQLWLFIVAPLIGGAIAAVAYQFVRSDAFRDEDVVSA